MTITSLRPQPMPWGCIGFGFPYSWHLYWVVDVCLDTLRLDNTYLYTLNEHRWLSVPPHSTPRALREHESGGHEVTDSQVRAPVLRFANVENDGKAARRNGGWSDPVLHLSGTTSSYGSLSHSSTQRTANIQGKGGANPVAIPSQSTKFLEPYKRRWRVTTL